MKILQLIGTIVLCILLFSTNGNSAIFPVSSQQEFNTANNSAAMNDSIVWTTGTYLDIRMDINNDGLTIMAEELGSVIFTGTSRANIIGDNIIFQGFQYLNGNIGTLDVINITGSHIKVTQININEYTCYKYLRVREESNLSKSLIAILRIDSIWMTKISFLFWLMRQPPAITKYNIVLLKILMALEMI